MIRVVALAALLLIGGCSSPAPSPSPKPTGVFALPTVDTSSWDACAGIGILDAHLTGNPSDPRVAWLDGGFGRKEIVVPLRFTARFEPELEILDQTGVVVAREGDIVDGGCVTGSGANSPLLILWP